MGIVHVRIDDRLIHGQVAAFWSNSLNIDRIMVANDEVSTNDLQKTVLRMAAPPSVRTSIIAKVTAATNIKAGKYNRERVLLILKNPKDALDLIELGVEIPAINVGNMAYREGTTQIKKSVNVTNQDIESFNKLNDLGIRLTAKMVPDEKDTNLMDFMKKLK
jgi:mannose PTS system EIIAB component